MTEARLLGRPDFDPDLYLEACTHLREQEFACGTEKEELELHHDWFRDAFFPREFSTKLERETLIPPYPFHAKTSLLEQSPRLARKVSGSTHVADKSGLANVRLYGDRVFTSIHSGLIANIPPSFCHVLGTGQLDCCQALAGVTEENTLFLAHIPGPGPSTARQLLSDLLEKTRFLHACFLYPRLPEDDYLHPRDAEIAQTSNAWFEHLARSFDLPSLSFLSSSTPGQRRSSLSGLRTLVTVEPRGICLSVNQERLEARPHRRYSEHYTPLTTTSIIWE